jgi:hypothetical protein
MVTETPIKEELVEDIEQPFNPGKHLRKLQKGWYLDVKWRLVWALDDCQRQGYALIYHTEVLHREEAYALVKAEVQIVDTSRLVQGPNFEKAYPLVRRATAHGSETFKDFTDFLEKAETKALGRALAMVGYGTQFTDEMDEGGRIADSPVDSPKLLPAMTFNVKK